jgi:hypothetical protein
MNVELPPHDMSLQHCSGYVITVHKALQSGNPLCQQSESPSMLFIDVQVDELTRAAEQALGAAEAHVVELGPVWKAAAEGHALPGQAARQTLLQRRRVRGNDHLRNAGPDHSIKRREERHISVQLTCFDWPLHRRKSGASTWQKCSHGGRMWAGQTAISLSCWLAVCPM